MIYYIAENFRDVWEDFFSQQYYNKKLKGLGAWDFDLINEKVKGCKGKSTA